MRSVKSVLIVGAILIALLVGATSAFAAQNATFVSASSVGCTIFVTFTVEDAGTYYFNTWDDGSVINSQAFTVGAGATVDASYTLSGAPLAGVAGVGLYLQPDPGGLTNYDRIDPFLITVPSGGCGASVSAGGCGVAVPSTSVQGRVQFTVNALFEPRADALTNVTIPGGTAWYVLDGQNGYYQIFIACKASPVWVPADSLGPNFDAVWQGRPLPSSNQSDE